MGPVARQRCLRLLAYLPLLAVPTIAAAQSGTVTGKVTESIKPDAPHTPVELSVVPSGFRMDTFTPAQPAYVEFVSVTLICCPAVPLKV